MGNLDQVASQARDTVVQTQKQLARGTGLWMGSVRHSLVQIRSGGAEAGQGSGFFVSSAGDIFTAAHVVEGDRQVEICLEDGRVCAGQVVRTDTATDTALIKIDREGTSALPLGYSTALPVGAEILVAGFPINQAFEASGLQTLTPTVAQGIVSAQQSRKPMPYSRAVRLLQIDANVSPGQSGGPVFSRASGEVIGIISSGMVGPEGRTGICFASPIEYARDLLR
ncbi:MAG: S1C family serine protease [Armatimonadota bacterium]